MFRRKLRRKLEAVDTGGGWISVLEKPWGQFTFELEAWRGRSLASSPPTRSTW